MAQNPGLIYEVIGQYPKDEQQKVAMTDSKRQIMRWDINEQSKAWICSPQKR